MGANAIFTPNWMATRTESRIGRHCACRQNHRAGAGGLVLITWPGVVLGPGLSAAVLCFLCVLEIGRSRAVMQLGLDLELGVHTCTDIADRRAPMAYRKSVRC